MNPDRGGLPARLLWIPALLVAIGIVAADGASRMRAIEDLTEMRRPGSLRVVEAPESPTGYASGVRNLVLPAHAVDGYHWILQTQRMLAGGGLRIRHVDYDNAPYGREVHWSSGFRWWLGILARWDAARSGTPLGIAVERVAPQAGTLLLVAMLLILTPLLAWRFGALPASLFALALATVHPVYELFAVGIPDHHGMVAAFGTMTVLFLVAGGGGWLRGAGSEPAWLPERRSARRWFVAAAVAGGAGLWVSAATLVPVLVGIGLGALLGAALRARPDEPWAYDPTLFRVWGIAGACTTLAFYLLEYAPSHFGLRLEVNHPLYALAWLGAGDLLCRACGWLRGERGIASPAALASLLAVAILPLCVVFARERTFLVADPFLWALHEDYINEFRGLLDQVRANPWRVVLASYGVLPLLGIPMLAGVAFTRLARPWKALLLVTLLPGAVTFALALGQNRWLGISCAVWIAALVTSAAATTMPGSGFRWSLGGRVAALAFLAAVFLPYPYLAAPSWRGESEIPLVDLYGVAGRDVAHRLRQELGDRRAVVVSGPSMTTALVYHGGLEGVGTLYWENLAGLKATAALFGARSEEEARAWVAARGVTHLVLFSWEPFVEEYARLARGLRADQPAPDDSFVANLVSEFLHGGALPPWLRALPYALPPDAAFRGQRVLILEVVPPDA